MFTASRRVLNEARRDHVLALKIKNTCRQDRLEICFLPPVRQMTDQDVFATWMHELCP